MRLHCRIYPLLILWFGIGLCLSAEKDKWMIRDGGIELVALEDYNDHFAMSGRSADLILEWKIDGNGVFSATQLIRWPMLRTIPNNTHAALSRRFQEETEARPEINSVPLSEGKVKNVRIDGLFQVVSDHPEGLRSVRTIVPSSSSPAILEVIELSNTSDISVPVKVPEWKKNQETAPGTRGICKIEEFILGCGNRTLLPGDNLVYTIIRSARLPGDAPYCDNPGSEIAARKAFVREMEESLVLKTPDPILNEMFKFAKIRGTESIFSTRGGLMHGPGGYNKFLAAIWTNDQVEYINPFFPFLGNSLGNESAMNSFRWFAKYMNPDFKSIPSSIISEGDSYWNGAGDRGDQAMIAYGAARFALASGNESWGRELLPLIDWSLEYCRRHKNEAGVVNSDSDELEGRFPSGKANLCTNILYYDALLSASSLWKAIDPSSSKAAAYHKEAELLLPALKKYFEGNVEGFDTYKYYESNTVLRSWICMPLIAGIHDRAEATTDALFSEKLWFGNGMLTASNTKTYWDRSALYAFRGVIAAGLQDRALPKLADYSRERLLGSHVPYAIEAWPEANQSQLSAESGLYCRIFTEGLFGITPTGFRSFSLLPRLPQSWNETSLQKMNAFGASVDIDILRENTGIRVKITSLKGSTLYDKTLPEGTIHHILLP